MVELLLFLGTICLFYFVPVQFAITYTNKTCYNRAELELSFLNGLLRLKKEIQFQIHKSGIKTETAKKGRWFWQRERTSQEEISPLQGSANGFWEYFERYRNFGMGITLLSYFLPARYHQWLLVAENLERRGEFQRLSWSTQLGTGDPALTAVGIGVVWGAKETLIGYLQSRYGFMQPPEVSVAGNFESFGLDTSFNCIFRVKLGHIIIAALMVRLRHVWRKGGVGK